MIMDAQAQLKQQTTIAVAKWLVLVQLVMTLLPEDIIIIGSAPVVEKITGGVVSIPETITVVT